MELNESETLTTSEDHHPSPPLSSLSLTLLLPPPPAIAPPAIAGKPFTLKIPTQISSLTRISLSPSNISTLTLHSNLSSSTLSSPSPFLRRRPSDPPTLPLSRRCTLLWLRSDLRIHDNEALTSASHSSLSLLPLYLFDPRDYSKSSSGFDKTGPHRAAFIIQSVADLRRSLRARGSDLVVRIGRPENVIVELAKLVGADAVYAHREVSGEEARMEERVEGVMEREGVEVKWFWGSTLYHIDDLGFELEKMPASYGGFRERVKGLSVRRSVEGLDRIKGLPARGGVEVGEIPTLMDLGLSSLPCLSKVCARDFGFYDCFAFKLVWLKKCLIFIG